MVGMRLSALLTLTASVCASWS